MQNPLYWLILAGKFDDLAAVPVFALQFAFIDKSNEDQLSAFILSFKAYQVG